MSRLSLFLHHSLQGWHPGQYAVISVTGLAGMLALEGWLHSVMLGLAAWPVLIAAYSRFKARATSVGNQ